jgi:alpha-methylacyl-CoA racemase
MMLADMGADVLRVQRPQAGIDPTDPTLRGRRCIELDLKKPGSSDAVLHLIDHVDVLVEGFRPGVAERLGLGPEVCLDRHPGLVYGRITGWGQTGPLSHTAGHDINYLALSGLLHQIGPPGGKPLPPMNVIADYGGGGLMLAFGVVCALRERERSGRGQVVDAAMVDGAASFMAAALGLRALGVWRDAPGRNFLTGAAHYYDTYETKDGRWVAVGAIEPQFHDLLLRKLGLDPREFSEGVGFDAERYERLIDDVWPRLRLKLAAAIRHHTRAELEALFDGTDACVTPVLNLDEAATHPQNVARGVFVEVDGVVQHAPAPRFSRSAPSLPRAGVMTESSDALSRAGVSPAAIQALRANGALR